MGQGNFRKRADRGFSIVELLIVVAIIGILMAMYMATFQKVQRKAHQVAQGEAIRQNNMGRMADDANIVGGSDKGPANRAKARALYRQSIRTAEGDIIVSRLAYHVSTAQEFEAYYHTLINPNASGALQFTNSGQLIARDPMGNEFHLHPLPEGIGMQSPRFANAVVAWEFLSKRPAESSSQGLGANVIFADGRIEYIRYPGRFPVCRAVAERSHEFLQATS